MLKLFCNKKNTIITYIDFRLKEKHPFSLFKNYSYATPVTWSLVCYARNLIPTLLIRVWSLDIPSIFHDHQPNPLLTVFVGKSQQRILQQTEEQRGDIFLIHVT